MINTYQTSVAAPALPPRTHRNQPVLIPTQLPPHGSHKVLIQFLIGVVLLHLFLSLGGFTYLYFNSKQSIRSQQDELPKKAFAGYSFHKDSGKALAVMVARKEEKGALSWNTNHSTIKGIECHDGRWLTIQQPGVYYVFSKVTFSGANPSKLTSTLTSTVMLRKNSGEKKEKVMEASCNLVHPSGSSHAPQMCTAMQGQLLTLQSESQLSLWVDHPSTVDYSDSGTTFGMFKL